MMFGNLKTRWIASGIVLLSGLGLRVVPAQGQTPVSTGAGAIMLISSSTGGEKSLAAQSLPTSARPGDEILREIDDPVSGKRWLLVRDDSHPGGPGLLLLANGKNDVSRAAVRIGEVVAAEAQANPPVIRSGDHVQMEEHSPTVDARLAAVALTPAWLGSAFNARLAIGGQLVRAVAIGPGRANFEQQVPVQSDPRPLFQDQKQAAQQ
jgi:hypothetical protein